MSARSRALQDEIHRRSIAAAERLNGDPPIPASSTDEAPPPDEALDPLANYRAHRAQRGQAIHERLFGAQPDDERNEQ